jgi:hypothetical protein
MDRGECKISDLDWTKLEEWPTNIWEQAATSLQPTHPHFTSLQLHFSTIHDGNHDGNHAFTSLFTVSHDIRICGTVNLPMPFLVPM